MGYVQSKDDYSLFIKQTANYIIIVAIYVDDIIITGNDLQQISFLKSHLHNTFTIKDLGVLNYFLGMEIGYEDKAVTMSQAKFTRELLEMCGISSYKPVVTLFPFHLKLEATDGDLLTDPSHYRCLVGKLNFQLTLDLT